MVFSNDLAIILRRFPFGEGDFVLTLFTKKKGKTKVIAKGVRKITSRRGGQLDLFNLVEVQIRESKGMGFLTEGKAIKTFSKAKKQLKKLGLLYYISELMDKLFVEEESHPEIFEALELMLDKIENISDVARIEEKIRDLEVLILKQLGHWSDNVQGKIYAKLTNPKEFNHGLIEQIAEKPLKSKKFLENI